MAQNQLRDLLQQAVNLMKATKWTEAEAILRPLMSEHQFNPAVMFNLGQLCWQTQRPDEAVSLWRRSIGADPNFVPAMVNLANILQLSGDHREALRYAQMALRRSPENPYFRYNVGLILGNLGEHADAVDALRDTLSIEPNYHRARLQLLFSYEELHRYDEAIEEAIVLATAPDLHARALALVSLTSVARRTSRWDLIDRYQADLEAAVRTPEAMGINPLALCFSLDDPELLHRLAVGQLRSPFAPSTQRRQWAGGQVTIAYLSPDLRNHPVAHMLLPILQHHDRKRFRIIALDTLPPDDSPLGQAIGACVDERIDLTRLDDSEAYRLLQSRSVDVLIDLAGMTKWNRPSMLARKPCPLQLLWLGCACTTGAPWYDGIILDGIVAPPGMEACYSEPVLRLPVCFHPISSGMPPDQRSTMRRADVGLPDDAVVIGLLQGPHKIRPPFIDHIARVMAQHPEAHLWLRVHQDFAERAIDRLVGLGMRRDRLHFAPRFVNREDYLAAYRLVDLLIDTQPYGGHSTTGEALCEGAAVLATAGRSLHTRIAASMLNAFGLGDLVCPDMNALLTQLDRLLGNPGEMASWKARFQDAKTRHAANGDARLTAELEALLLRQLAENSNARG